MRLLPDRPDSLRVRAAPPDSREFQLHRQLPERGPLRGPAFCPAPAPSGVNRFPDRRKLQMETCTLSGTRNGFDRAPVLLNNSVCDRKAEPRALLRRFGREEWIVDAAQVLGRDAMARVDHFHDHAVFASRILARA